MSSTDEPSPSLRSLAGAVLPSSCDAATSSSLGECCGEVVEQLGLALLLDVKFQLRKALMEGGVPFAKCADFGRSEGEEMTNLMTSGQAQILDGLGYVARESDRGALVFHA